ncbi:Aste57867_8085 [Aphanomyces stellatus]|uniref:Aste57867_8085 protein n=1 Tax=Aphanomyces stellatus TaxID=120398 RepID=A0A485KJB3_9STRA|nr:hypothetical protein As57867_008055 [Aphanomyces stellatus]VFT84974.1 Aste57867_8085 [Aphanomyces stellatus]
MSAHELPDKFQKMRMQHAPLDQNKSIYPPSSSNGRSSGGPVQGLYHSGIPIGQRGSNTSLYSQGITSPQRPGYLPQRGSSQDLYQAGVTTPVKSGGGRDLIAAAAAASQKNRQLRGRPGTGSNSSSPLAHAAFNDPHAAYFKNEGPPSSSIRKNHSWNSVDSLDRHYEEPTSTIRLPRSQTAPTAPVAVPPPTFQMKFSQPQNFDDLDEEDSSSIGYTEDFEEMKRTVDLESQGFDHDYEEDDSESSAVSTTVGYGAGPTQHQHHHHQQQPLHYVDESPPAVHHGQHHLHGNHTGPYVAAAHRSPARYHVHHAQSARTPSSPSALPSPSPPVPGLSTRAASHRPAPTEKPFDFTSGTRQEGDISIWVGSWNLGAADPFSDSRGLMDDADTARMVRHLVPLGYDLYVLGVQEGVNENVYFAIQAYLNRNPQLLRYQRKELRNDKVVFPNKQAPIDAVFDAVRGRGDGAFMGTKFTGMAVFCGDHVSADVQVLRAGIHKFNIASGSKGGVAVALKLKYTTVCFINCHLDARNDTYRREQIRLLNTNLGKVMGHPSFDLTEQFHHVVWMGDLNYRIVRMEATEVLRLLSENRIAELHERGDGLLNDRKHGIFEGFEEPEKFLNFYPTYKKYPLRGHVDTTDPNWPEHVYRVLYKEPFYKGGQVKKRVPGWCDRILIHSTPIRNSQLVAEKVPCPFIQGRWVDNYQSINDGVGMDVSDHSPVTCSMLLKFSRPPLVVQAKEGAKRPLVTATDVFGGSYTDLRPSVRLQGPSYAGGPNGPMTTVITLHSMTVTWNNHVHVPKKTRVVAPLLGEDESGKQTEATGERTISVTNLSSLSLNLKMHHERSLQDLHMLVWVRHDTFAGHCVVSLQRVATLLKEGGDGVRYKSSLYHNSVPVVVDGFPVKLIFSVKPNNFQKN